MVKHTSVWMGQPPESKSDHTESHNHRKKHVKYYVYVFNKLYSVDVSSYYT